jgi:hypothetical protein
LLWSVECGLMPLVIHQCSRVGGFGSHGYTAFSCVTTAKPTRTEYILVEQDPVV